MPWNEPGRGSNGGQNPWKGGGNNQKPPDLDEVFANVQRRLKSIMGGGKNSGDTPPSDGKRSPMGMLGLLLLAAVVWAAWNSVHIVDEPERGVVLRFGEHVRTLNQGLNFTLPSPIEQVYKVDVGQLRSLQGSSRILTGDENLIEIKVAVQYRVLEPEKFLFHLERPIFSLEHAIDSAIREVVGINDLVWIMEKGRQRVATASEILLQEMVDLYDAGIEITSFSLEDLQPPSQVMDAFEDVVRAREDEVRFQNEAQAYANGVIPEARGRAARIREQAEGYKASVIERANGEAERFSSVYTEYRLAPEVTRQRLYLEAMEGVLGKTPKVMLDAESGNNLLYLPLDRLGGAAGRSMPPPPLLPSSESGRGNETETESRGRRGREER